MAIKKYTDEELKERKKASQKAYAKRTNYAANARSLKKNTKMFVLECRYSTDADIIEMLESKKGEEGYTDYIRQLIKNDMSKSGN